MRMRCQEFPFKKVKSLYRLKKLRPISVKNDCPISSSFKEIGALFNVIHDYTPLPSSKNFYILITHLLEMDINDTQEIMNAIKSGNVAFVKSNHVF